MATNRSNRRFLLSSASLLFAAVVLAGCESTVPRVMGPGSFSTVVIDAGHGGHDSGERPGIGRTPEKEVALDTAKRLQSLLRDAGLKTVMTRSDDTFVELDDRVRIADRYGPDAILVSIHYDASGSSARGVHTFFWRPDSQGLATRVQRSMLSETGQPNLGVIRRVLRLTHNPNEPSILCECGFLTNSTDYALANTPGYRQKVAEGIADGIVDQHEKGDYDLMRLPPVVSYRPTRHAYRHHHVTAGKRHKAAGKKASGKKRSAKASGKKKKKS